MTTASDLSRRVSVAVVSPLAGVGSLDEASGLDNTPSRKPAWPSRAVTPYSTTGAGDSDNVVCLGLATPPTFAGPLRPAEGDNRWAGCESLSCDLERPTATLDSTRFALLGESVGVAVEAAPPDAVNAVRECLATPKALSVCAPRGAPWFGGWIPFSRPDFFGRLAEPSTAALVDAARKHKKTTKKSFCRAGKFKSLSDRPRGT